MGFPIRSRLSRRLSRLNKPLFRLENREAALLRFARPAEIRELEVREGQPLRRSRAGQRALLAELFLTGLLGSTERVLVVHGPLPVARVPEGHCKEILPFVGHLEFHGDKFN